MKGNGLPPNIPLQRGIFNLEEIDLVDVLDARFAGYAIKGIQLNRNSDKSFKLAAAEGVATYREDIYEKYQPEPTTLNKQEATENLGINNHIPLIGR